VATTVRDLVMPKLGLTMKQGRVTRWYRKPGESFKKGEPLLQVTTEKVAVDVEAAWDGILVEILVEAGQTVPVGRPIARVEVDAPAGYAPAPRPAPPADTPARGQVRASPAAKRVARELGVDVAAVPGTGPEGRITEEDVRRFTAGPGDGIPTGVPGMEGAGPEAVVPSESVPHSQWRQSVARGMVSSAQATAPVTLHRDVVFRAASNLLRDSGGEPERAGRVGLLDVVIKAVAEALREHPDLNATYTDEALVRHLQVNIGVALALPEGLLVPVLREADRLTLTELAARRQALIERARAGRLAPADITGGTFTVSNLGPLGVEGFTPIINLPEVAILGVGRIGERPVAAGGRVVVEPVLPLSLTFDHRAVDGAPAAAFLGAVASRLESPPPAWTPRKARLPADDPDAFDLVVIGAGPAGFTAAVTAAGLGARVAVVERDLTGGVCLNRGCIPTKAALEWLAHRAGADNVGDAEGLFEAVTAAVTAVRSGAENRLADLGVTVIRGEASLGVRETGGGKPRSARAASLEVNPPVVLVGGRVLEASGVLLATGSEPVPFELPAGLAAEVVSVEDLLSRPRRPAKALVVGGGPGGVEAARILALGGSEVTLVEKLGGLLPGEEDDAGVLVRTGLERIGVMVLTSTDIRDADRLGAAGRFDLAVLAVGRRANLGSLAATEDMARALVGEQGFVRVDDYLRTRLPGLLAAGDVTGPPFWAHRAMEEGRTAALNLLAGLEGFPDRARVSRRPPPALVPRVVFADPEYGAVGLSRAAAEAAGHRVVVGTAPMAASSRANASGAAEGFVRVVADRDTGRLVGFEAVCPGATDLVAAGLVALAAGMRLGDLARTTFAHPTFSEAIGDAARDGLSQGGAPWRGRSHPCPNATSYRGLTSSTSP